MNPDTCFVITGLLEEEYITPLLKTYKGITEKILSTWRDTPSSYIQQFIDADFKIVLNDKPNVESSLNLQVQCILNGCNLARNMGYKYVIRTRTDIWSWNILLFAQCTRTKYIEKLTCLSGETSIDGKNNHYFHDTIISGNIDDIIRFYKFKPENDIRWSEKFLQEIWSGKTDLTRKDICELFNFCAEDARKAGVQLVWNPKKGLFELIFDLTMRPWFFTEP